MDRFVMNGYLWRVEYIDPYRSELIDRTGQRTVATTDPLRHTVYISNELSGDFLYHVLIHELGHCAMVSFDLFDAIHRMVHPECWIEAEEWVCNFLADYGAMVFSTARQVLGNSALIFVPYELERMIA